jgi:hypothetical protein
VLILTKTGWAALWAIFHKRIWSPWARLSKNDQLKMLALWGQNSRDQFEVAKFIFLSHKITKQNTQLG